MFFHIRSVCNQRKKMPKARPRLDISVSERVSYGGYGEHGWPAPQCGRSWFDPFDWLKGEDGLSMKDLRYARRAANGQAALLLAALSTGTPCSLITMASDFASFTLSPLSHRANQNIIIRTGLSTPRRLISPLTFGCWHLWVLFSPFTPHLVGYCIVITGLSGCLEITGVALNVPGTSVNPHQTASPLKNYANCRRVGQEDLQAEIHLFSSHFASWGVKLCSCVVR